MLNFMTFVDQPRLEKVAHKAAYLLNQNSATNHHRQGDSLIKAYRSRYRSPIRDTTRESEFQSSMIESYDPKTAKYWQGLYDSIPEHLPEKQE